MSEYLPSVIFDILKEEKIADHLDFFLNTEDKKDPSTPVLPFSFSVNAKDMAPDIEIPVIFGVSGPKNKYPVFKHFNEKWGIESNQFLSVIHNSTYIAPSASVGLAAFVEQRVVVGSQTVIGFGVTIKRGALMGHHCVVGDFVDINPGVIISGRVKIGSGTFIGSGAIIIDGITIGKNSLIGAGSVVTKDIPAGVIAYGNPCKVIRENKEWKI